MTVRLARIEAIAIAALVLAACTDDRRDLLAPTTPDKALLLPQPLPRPTLPSPTDFVQIAAGGNHTCARRFNGDVLCWGQDGQGGYEHITQAPTLANQGATQLAVGGTHACTINGAGAAFCWGGGDFGQLGTELWAQIGSGAGWVLGPKDPNSYYGTLAPLSFSSIAASGNSTCGIAASGLYCWGMEGTPMHPDMNSVPTLIVTPSNYSPNFTQVAIGNQHVCGYSVGEVDCYGADQVGQAGSDPNNTIYFPGTKMVIVAIGSNLRTGVSRVAAQGDFTCVDMTAGTVQCFGNNTEGELGNAPGGFSFNPVSVGGGQALHGVATGFYHACALDANSEAWCWGYNYFGMVGNGTWGYNTSAPQKVLGVSTGYHTNGATIKFRSLAAGMYHTCGISLDNHIYCWGSNSVRQLGAYLVDANGQSLSGGWVGSPVLVM